MKRHTAGWLIAYTTLGLTLWGAQSAKPGERGNAEKGKNVFAAKCAVCHATASSERKIGPGLKGLFKKPRLVDGKPMNEANVRARIETGGKGMPPYRQLLDAAQLDDLIAYLKTL